MKIVIDIPYEMYLNAKKGTLCGSDIIVSAIKNGTPIKEGAKWKNESKRNLFSTCKERIYWRVCSACGWCREDCNPANDTPYCPNCGAMMERSRK